MIKRDRDKISKPLSNPAVGLLIDTIEHFELSQIVAAKGLNISRSYLNGVLKSKRGVSVELALRAQAYLGVSAELLVKLQAQYDFEKSYHENYTKFENSIVRLECA
jgi:addiction module HigA family antidote